MFPNHPSQERLLCCLAVFMANFWSLTAFGAELRWSYHGPFGAEVTALAIDPNQTSTVYVATQGGGVFRSDDGGDTWNRKSSGLGRRLEVTDLSLGPGNPASLFISTAPFGLFTSTDRGESWTELASTGLPSGLRGAYKITAHPTDAARLWVSVEGTTRGIYRSTNGGATWSVSTASITPLGRGSFLEIDPSDPLVLFAGVDTELSRTLDGGDTWTPVGTTISSRHFWAFAIDPANPQSILVAQNQRLARSPDRGTTFPEILDFPGTPVTSIAIDPTNSDILYLATESRGIYKSIDGGTTIFRLNDPVLKEQYGVVMLEPGNPSTLYAGAEFDGGVFKSTNGGTSWTEKNQGLLASRIQAVAAAPSNPLVVYAGTSGNGVFKSLDGGVTWNRAANGLPSAGQVYSLLIDPANADVVFAGTSYHLYGTTNGGAAWTQLHPGTPFLLRTLAFEPPSTTELVAASAHDIVGGIYRSPDGGATWAETGSDGDRPRSVVSTFALDPSNPLVLYADSGGTLGGVTRSFDGGLTWDPANTGIDLGFGIDIRAMALSPITPTTLVIATDRGVYHSIDGANTWLRTDPNAAGFNGVAAVADPLSADTAYVARYSTSQTLVNKVTGDGALWTGLATDASDSAILTLALHPVDGSVLYAGTSGNGVGVFERANEILFADGFESGNTSRWSLVVE